MSKNNNYKRIIIKIGSNVLTDSNGLPDTNTLQSIVEQVSKIKESGVQIILVSSGAVAAGRSMFQIKNKAGAIAQKQLYSALGQVKLMELYKSHFQALGAYCAQVLVTKSDFRDRKHYLNMKNCLNVLLENDVVPIVNENDVISVTELMFTDNDELAGLVAAMLNADALFILSNVDGVFTGDPNSQNSKLIKEFKGSAREISQFVVTQKSEFGRGGMITKCRNALKVANLGIHVHIANGKKPFIIQELYSNDFENRPGTFFPASKSTSNVKKWVASSNAYSKGKVIINKGAQEALFSKKANSLLPIGILSIKGEFKKGDIISIYNESELELGIGISAYSSDSAKKIIKKRNVKPMIHYDYLYLNEMEDL